MPHPPIYKITQKSQTSKELRQRALAEFSSALRANTEKLEVRHLGDFYRIKGMPLEACKELATALLPEELISSIEGLDPGNCRMNAFFIPEAVNHPHNHPSSFVSYMIGGGYSHSILAEEIDVNNRDLIQTERIKINTKAGSIHKLGEATLRKLSEQLIAQDELVVFHDTQAIHRIDLFAPNTLTVNFLSNKSSNEMEIFVPPGSPESKIMLESDPRTLVNKALSAVVIEKCIEVLTNT